MKFQGAIDPKNALALQSHFAIGETDSRTQPGQATLPTVPGEERRVPPPGPEGVPPGISMVVW